MELLYLLQCCTDTWGDWREHLAMILSNQHVNINNARNATIQLGDSLSMYI